MKKSYSKPVIMVENFMLSEYIASCDPKFSNNYDIDNLMQDLKGFTCYFNDAYECSKKASSGQTYTLPDGTSLCYHTSASVVFSS